MIRKICNTGYFLPAVLGLLFYGTIALSGGFFSIHPLAWCFVALLFLCAVWMRKQKWWGCLGGDPHRRGSHLYGNAVHRAGDQREYPGHLAVCLLSPVRMAVPESENKRLRM